MEAVLLFAMHSSTCTAVNAGFWYLDAAKFYEMRFKLNANCTKFQTKYRPRPTYAALSLPRIAQSGSI
jgi:hypothetical protein